MMTDKILHDIYYNEANPASYSGVEKILIEAQKINQNIKRQDVENWLEGELVYTLHKPVIKRFKRNPIVVERSNVNFQADLVDMREFSTSNNGYCYILTVIDVFSKRAWGIPIKNKSAQTVASSMENILKNNNVFKIQTDKGKEFENSEFKKLMKKYDINHFTTNNSDIKCAIVERFNRTLKNKMFRFFTKTGKRRYIDAINSLVLSYNKTYHRTIKMSPFEVNENNEKQVFKNIYGFNSLREMLRKYKKPSLKFGDTVRRKYKFGPLDRGYYPNWTDQTFTVDKDLKYYKKPLYQIKDSNNQQLKQRFYSEELQKIKNTKTFRVEKILRERIYRRQKQYFVKWLNHPSSENEWVLASDIFKI